MKKLIIFDLDGTLLNTIADLAQSTNHALQALGYPTHPESAYNFMVGNGINKLFERALPEGEKSEENVLRVRKEFVPYYDVHLSLIHILAAQRTFYGYNDMADAKALLESIARSFGYIYGREHHVRVNTISQSPTMTTAGSGVKGMDKLFDFANRMSPLGNASADECADYCIVMFSDLTRKVTMQNLFHDGGFSSVGMSLRAMATYEKGLDEYKDENGNIIYG